MTARRPETVGDSGVRAVRTRADWEALADRTLAAVRPYATPDHALIHLPGPESRSGRWSDGLEGFARTFLLAGFRLARSGGRDPGGHAAWYAQGLAAGTDPDSPERWPELADCWQARVECASVALALHESRPWIWDRLDPRTQADVVRWMGAFVGLPIPDNNWTWFRAVTEAFLRSVGGPWSREDLEHTFARTEAWYVGDGWYSDGEAAPGEPRCFDYYSGWAMHFYPLWYCRMSGDEAEEGLENRYRERLRRYLADAELLVGADVGSGQLRPLMQGRSLTYRFAMLAPFWTGALFDATPLSPGRTRRLADGVLGHFLERGCYDADGLLPIGWHRAYEPMREPYSGGGSPYWASKGFAGLVLPEDHPVWTAAEEPLPIETGDVALSLPRLGWIVSGTRADGVVRVAQHGGDHAAAGGFSIDVPGYARHGYSTHTAPGYGLTAPADLADSHVALVTEDGRVSHRAPALNVHVGEDCAVSRHRAHWWLGTGPIPNDPHHNPDHLAAGFEAGPWVTTASVFHGPLEVRLARVDQPAPGDQCGPWTLSFSGWPLDDSTAGGLTSTITALRGEFTHDLAVYEGSSPLADRTSVPLVRSAKPVQYGRVYAALVVLSGVVDGEAAAQSVGVEVLDDDVPGATRIAVTWPDGDRTELPLPAVTPTGRPNAPQARNLT
jgi:hypothetical protein